MDSMARTGIELAMQNKPWALLELLEKERENFYVHPNNVIENELGFHQLLVVLYQMCYGNTKTAFTKIVPLMEITRLHIYAWEVMKGEEHPYYIDVLADLLRCCIWAEEYEKRLKWEKNGVGVWKRMMKIMLPAWWFWEIVWSSGYDKQTKALFPLDEELSFV